MASLSVALLVSGLVVAVQASPLAGRDAVTPVCSAWPYKIAQNFASYAPFQSFCSSRFPVAAVTVLSTVTPDPTTIATTVFTTDVTLVTSISVETDYSTAFVATATEAVVARAASSNGSNAFLSTACSCIETPTTTYMTITANAITAFETETVVILSTLTSTVASTTTIEVDVTTVLTVTSTTDTLTTDTSTTDTSTTDTSTTDTSTTDTAITDTSTTDTSTSTSTSTSSDTTTESTSTSTTTESTTSTSDMSTSTSDSTTSTSETSTSTSESTTSTSTTSSTSSTSTTSTSSTSTSSTSTTTSPTPTPSNLVTNGGFDGAVDGAGAVPFWAHSGNIVVGHTQGLAHSKTQYATFDSKAGAAVPQISQTLFSSTAGTTYSLTFYYLPYNITGLDASSGSYCDLLVSFGSSTLPDIKVTNNVVPAASPVAYTQYGPIAVTASQDAVVLGLTWDCATHGGSSVDGTMLVDDVSVVAA